MIPAPDSAWVIALAATTGGLVALAFRELALASPGIVRWLAGSLEPLSRAGREGYLPTRVERRRLAAVGALGVLVAGVLVVGPGPVVLLALSAPAAAGWGVAARRARYRRGVERGIPAAASATADALSGGRSPRAGLIAAAESLDGPIAVELAMVRADLELGAPLSEALQALRRRIPSPRIDSFSAALLSQQLGGGDLAALLRRLASAGAERERAAADARSASSQARFTGLLVVAMPAAAGLFGELIFPGFIGRVLSEPASMLLVGFSAGLQLIGFFAIRRLSRVEI